MPDTLFYFFAALTLAAALLVAVCRNPVNSAMAMLLALLGIAANFFLLQAPFLGVLQVLVYAGAVMVLFVFVITLLDVPRMGARKLSFSALGTGIFALVAVSAALLWLVWAPGHLPEPAAAVTPPLGVSAAAKASAAVPYASGAKPYGQLLFGKYMLPTLATAFLLLCAMLGVFLLIGKKQPDSQANK